MDCKLEIIEPNLITKAKVTGVSSKWLAAVSMTAVVFSLSACDTTDCTVADQLHLNDSLEYNGTSYFLYTRTTGFQEKQVFFELYDHKPTFDQCGGTQTKEVFATDYDHRRYVKELILRPEETSYDDRLKIIYTDDPSQGYSNVNDVKINR